MDQDSFIAVLRTVNMASDKELISMLDEPIRETEFDSLDFEIFRTALEKKLGHEIDEQLWQDAATLRALMEAV